jgi:hypothetical protein
VYDEQQALDTLTVEFASDVDGVFCTPTPDANGGVECEYALSPGEHRLVFTVTDAEGLEGTDEFIFVVTAGTDIDDDEDGWTEEQGDCNDEDGSVNPGATEYYNDRDDDCDGLVDDGTAGYDDDVDGYSELEGDCDDVTTYQGATELCDSQDNDCDGESDEDTECSDDDGDSWTELSGDCDDAYTGTYPGAAELEDGEDNDCDGTVDEGTNAYDDDGDGYTENSGDCNDGSA